MKIYFKKWRLLVFPIAMLIMGVIGVRTCMDPKVLWIGMLLVTFSITGLYFGIYPFVHFRPAVIIDERGVEDRRMKIGAIPWSDIDDVFLHPFTSNADLCLKLKNPDDYINKGVTIAGNVQLVQKKTNQPGIYIAFGSFACDVNEAKECVKENIERFGSGGQAS